MRAVASVVFVVAMVASACSRAGAREEQGHGTTISRAILASGAGSIALLPKDTSALPTFDFPRFQTLLHQLALKKVPVVVNIWASWCGPCRIEAPNLVKAAERYGTGVQFLGVDILDQLGPARQFIQEERYAYPSVFDPTGDIRDRLGYLGQPVTIFYDASGRKVGEWSGAIGPPDLTSRISNILPR
jgi:thiol-disulfide isomerase/thioredoxin